MLSESQLSALLNSAVRAQATSQAPDGSLTPFLCQAVIQELKLLDIQLWQVDHHHVAQLWKSNSSIEWFSIDEESLRNIAVGELQNFEAVYGGRDSAPNSLSLTSVPIVDSARMTIAFLHSKEQNIEEDLFQVGEIVADIRRRELLKQLYESNQRHSRLFRFLTELHDAESKDALLELFVTDGVTISEFDRISIVSRKSTGGWTMAACTGVESISLRSEEVQRICSEVAYAERDHNLTGPIFPLSPNNEWALAEHAAVFEKQNDIKPADLQTGQLLASQMAMAIDYIANRQNKKRNPKRKKRSPSAVALAPLLLIGLIVVICFWQTEFRIKAVGVAVPKTRQEVFAPDHGIIQVVNVQHGQFVEQGDILFEVFNDELLVLRESTREELVTAQTRFAALQTISQRTGGSTQLTNGALPTSVELAELGKKIESLKTQVEMIDGQLKSLQVVAPFSGEVFRERMQEELIGRPVQQGQYVMQIAALDGPWELQLRVPENEIRHVTLAQNQQEESLSLTYALETSPEVERASSIDEISNTTDLDSFGRLSTLAVSQITKEEIPDVRYGAGVIAKIHCGKRPLGFLMTRRVTEFWAKYSPF